MIWQILTVLVRLANLVLIIVVALPPLEAWPVANTDPELKDKFEQLHVKLGPMLAGTPPSHDKVLPSAVTVKDEYNSFDEFHKDVKIAHSFDAGAFMAHIVASDGHQNDMHVFLENRNTKRQVVLEKGSPTMYLGDGQFDQMVEDEVPRYPLRLHSLNDSSRNSQSIPEKDAMLLYQNEAGDKLISVAQ